MGLVHTTLTEFSPLNWKASRTSAGLLTGTRLMVRSRAGIFRLPHHQLGSRCKVAPLLVSTKT